MSDELRIESDAEVEIDPVCGMTVAIEDATQHALAVDYEGRTYVFCGPGCRERFDHSPERYAVPGRTHP